MVSPDEPTPQQRAILQHIADGATNEEVARLLLLSPFTVRTHVTNALRRLRVRSRAHAVAVGFREGWLE